MKYLDKDGLLYFFNKIKNLLNNKVDKVSGKGLSTNDFTTAEKTKLSGIASGAEANVQSDWNITDTVNDGFIKNKPNVPTKISQLTNDSNFINNNYIATLNNIGLVKPDGKTINFDSNGIIKSYKVFINSIPDNSDLNNYNNFDVTEFYKCTTNLTAATLKNCPTKESFYMILGCHAGIFQEIIEYSPNKPKRYMRNFYQYSGGSPIWGEWVRIYSTVDPPKTSELVNDSNYKTIKYATTEPTTVGVNEIIMVYE